MLVTDLIYISQAEAVLKQAEHVITAAGFITQYVTKWLIQLLPEATIPQLLI